MGIEDEYTAYCFDGAVRTFGVYIQNKLQEKSNLGHAKHTIENLLEGRLGRGMKQFADPGGLAEVKQ